MRNFLLLLAVAGSCALLVWSLLASSETAPAPAGTDTAPVEPAGLVDRSARARLDALEAEVERLLGELDRLRSRPSAAPTREPATPASAPAASGSADRDPRWYLERYVASFAAGGSGSEYFRLAVDAYAPELAAEITSIVVEPHRPVELRASLVAMLGTPRFRGLGTAIGPLVGLVEREDETAAACVRALLVIGDPQCGRSLERIACRLRAPEFRKVALTVAVGLAQPHSALAIQRLLACLGDEDEAGHILSLADASDPDGLLDLFRAASTMDRGVRLAAAHRLADFRFEAIRGLAVAWHAGEADPDVRRRLERAMRKQAEKPSWCAEQAAGPPDADLGRDDARSWASATQDGGAEWLELAYPPLRASGVRVLQGLVGGAIAEIRVRDTAGAWSVVWAGRQADAAPGEARFDFATTARPVSAVRIVLDTRRTSGWKEIDAVELLGPEGRSWAIGATASSYYGQGGTGTEALLELRR